VCQKKRSPPRAGKRENTQEIAIEKEKGLIIPLNKEVSFKKCVEGGGVSKAEFEEIRAEKAAEVKGPQRRRNMPFAVE